MEQVTCPNCNVDVEPEELKLNNLRCPTCGFDLSDQGDVEELDDKDLEDEEEDDEEEDEDEEEE
jgi:Zn-finger nucleic acid-binding protein